MKCEAVDTAKVCVTASFKGKQIAGHAKRSKIKDARHEEATTDS